LTDRSSQTYAPPFDVALAYVGLGDYDQAFAWLEKAYDERARAMLSLKVNPLLDPLRSDPRFGALIRRMRILDSTGLKTLERLGGPPKFEKRPRRGANLFSSFLKH